MARNIRRLGHIDLPGAGQVCVAGKHAYVGHIPNKDHLGTSIVDISDPANPRVVANITLDDQTSHSHKARVVGDIMIVNHERNPTAIGRRADELPRVVKELTAAKGARRRMPRSRPGSASSRPTWRRSRRRRSAAITPAASRSTTCPTPRKPKEIAHHKTGGIGVHRFDMDERYAYISTEMEGYIGNILVIYDMRNPTKPQEVSRWWIPGQHIAGGETPTWLGRPASAAPCAALRRRDVGELLARRLPHRRHLRHGEAEDQGRLQLPSAVPGADPHRHAGAGTINGKRIALAVDEEDQAQSANEETARRGRAHACVLTFDVSDPADTKPLGRFVVSELNSPFSRTGGARFGAHQFCERMSGTICFATWFGGGLRVVDVGNPLSPREIGHYIPEPAGGRAAPQTNDVALDDKGLAYIVDRYVGFDVLEFRG